MILKCKKLLTILLQCYSVNQQLNIQKTKVSQFDTEVRDLSCMKHCTKCRLTAQVCTALLSKSSRWFYFNFPQLKSKPSHCPDQQAIQYHKVTKKYRIYVLSLSQLKCLSIHFLSFILPITNLLSKTLHTLKDTIS